MLRLLDITPSYKYMLLSILRLPENWLEGVNFER